VKTITFFYGIIAYPSKYMWAEHELNAI